MYPNFFLRMNDYGTHSLKQIVLGFGLLIFSLLALLRLSLYSHFTGVLSVEFLIGIIAILFFTLGFFINKNRKGHGYFPVVSRTDPDPGAARRIGLSRREEEILRLISEGLSNQQIGERIFVSENTVKKHVSNLFLKLEVERRTQAVKKGKELGIL